MEKILLPSEWGREITVKHIRNNNSLVAVFFPGQNYSCELPLLYYTGKSALDAGYDLLMLEYGYQSARTSFEEAKIDTLIQECFRAINLVIDNYKKAVFVSKSLGTYIAGRTAELFEGRSVEHLFLTPIKSSIPLIEKYGGLVICGTNDPVFKEKDMDQIATFPNTVVRRMQDANHALEVDDLNQSLEILKALTEDANRFFKEHRS
jgi:hypothetical protein